MSHITITDEQLRAAFNSAERPVNICGPDGKMIGFFTPLRLADIPLQISEEELARRFADKTGPWYTTDEVKRHLEGL